MEGGPETGPGVPDSVVEYGYRNAKNRMGTPVHAGTGCNQETVFKGTTP